MHGISTGSPTVARLAGPARPQSPKNNFVAKGVHGERESGPRNRELTLSAVEVVPPGFGRSSYRFS